MPKSNSSANCPYCGFVLDYYVEPSTASETPTQILDRAVKVFDAHHRAARPFCRAAALPESN